VRLGGGGGGRGGGRPLPDAAHDAAHNAAHDAAHNAAHDAALEAGPNAARDVDLDAAHDVDLGVFVVGRRGAGPLRPAAPGRRGAIALRPGRREHLSGGVQAARGRFNLPAHSGGRRRLYRAVRFSSRSGAA
jgi:hypothetical protein